VAISSRDLFRARLAGGVLDVLEQSLEVSRQPHVAVANDPVSIRFALVTVPTLVEDEGGEVVDEDAFSVLRLGSGLLEDSSERSADLGGGLDGD